MTLNTMTMENIQPILKAAARATSAIKALDSERKSAILRQLATAVLREGDRILTENKRDLDRMDPQDPKYDRLLLSAERLQGLADGIVAVSELPDPTGQLLSSRVLPNGLRVEKKTVALGVVGVIYESRPNVTLDVAALCIQSGNVCLLRGGSDALYTNEVLVGIIQSVLEGFGVDKDIVQLLPTDRKFVPELLTATRYVDILIPRGSQSLIDFVRDHAKVPVIETGAGVCHTYVEQTADIDKAARIVHNAKTSRPSVCNALDTVLLDRQIAPAFLAKVSDSLQASDVEIFADEQAYGILHELGYPQLQRANADDFGREFLDFKCSVKVVDSFDDALAHIREYSSKHSECIVSEDAEKTERFLNLVDAAAVYANASTRFTDGGEFGLGAEIGISTQKLHARGPFALEKLVTEKWYVMGDGQVR